MTMRKLMIFLILVLVPTLNVFAAIPLLLNYQGNVKDSLGVPVNGSGYFKFAILNQAGDTAYWLNNGAIADFPATIQSPPNAVSLPVSDGVFSVQLGNTNLTNMAALTQTVFDNSAIYLRVWFSIDNINFEQLSNDIQIVSSGFAFKAAVADQVAQNAVTSVMILDHTITGTDIAAGGIASSEIADNSITAADIATNGVGTAEIADNSITATDIAAGAVGSSEILDNTITNNDISASAAISASKLANGAGADFASGTGNTALSTTSATVMSITISAPSSGIAIVNASGYFLFSAAGLAHCSITTGTVVTATGASYVTTNSSVTNSYIPFASTYGFNVSASGPATYNLVCDLSSGTIAVIWPKMTAMFFPVQY